jgi:hypothetical protein
MLRKDEIVSDSWLVRQSASAVSANVRLFAHPSQISAGAMIKRWSEVGDPTALAMLALCKALHFRRVHVSGRGRLIS